MSTPRPKRANRESYVPDKPDAQGYWRGAVWAGWLPDGKPDRRWVKRRSKTERDRAVRKLERERDAGVLGRAGRKPPTVAQLLTRHLDVVLPQRGRAPRTIDGYRSVVDGHIAPALGGTRVDRLETEDVEDFAAGMLARGAAPAYVVKALAVLSAALQDQVRRGRLPRNPCWAVQPPELGEPAHKALTREQARAVLAAIEERRNAVRWKVGLACGLRQGEALGLRWPQVSDHDLKVWWQLQRLTWRHGCEPDMRAGTGDMRDTHNAYSCGRKRGTD
jgi:integrase